MWRGWVGALAPPSSPDELRIGRLARFAKKMHLYRPTIMALKVKRPEETHILEEVFMGLLGYKSIPRWMALLVCALIFMVVLAACGGSTTSNPTPTPTPTTAAKPSPTTPPTTTPPATAGFVTYTGSGFTINYPQGWKVTAAGTSVVFADPTGIYNLTIVVSPDPGGIASSDTVVNASIQGVKGTVKNPQAVNVPATVTIGGDSWVQKSISGGSSAGGQAGVVQLVVASDNHPANSPSTNSYTVIYATLQATFDAVSARYFQPMLQSFKFTA